MSGMEHFPGAEQLANFKVITADNFDEVVHQHPFVVIDFWASWCAPCRVFAQTFVEVAAAHPDVLFAAVNIEEQQSLADEFAIRSVPFVMVIREQVVVFAEAGQQPKPALETLLQQARDLNIEEIKKHSFQNMDE